MIMKILETHQKLRDILQEYGNEEYGDCIIDEICLATGFPTTTDFHAMAKDDSISFNEFHNLIRDLDEGDWDNVNSEDIIKQYISEKSKDGIQVSHILKAIEEEPSREELYEIWLGNSMETPTPINTKQDLLTALGI